MNKHKALMAYLLMSIFSLATSQRGLIKEWLHGCPAWWKLLLAVSVAILFTLCLIVVLGLLPLLLMLLGIEQH